MKKNCENVIKLAVSGALAINISIINELRQQPRKTFMVVFFKVILCKKKSLIKSKYVYGRI